MPNAHDTVKAYFEALVARDAETLIARMLPVSHYVKIGTDAIGAGSSLKSILIYANLSAYPDLHEMTDKKW